METGQARQWRWLILVISALENFLFSGIVFGWGSLVYVLKEEGIFAHLCHEDISNATSFETDVISLQREGHPNQSDVIAAGTNRSTGTVLASGDVGSVTSKDVVTSCARQDDMLALCYSIMSAVFFIGSSTSGMLAYKFGTRISRLTGWVSFTVGSLLLAVTTPENPWLLFGGMPAAGFGGITLLITDLQVGTLFEKGASTVIGTLCGLCDSSSIIMLFLKFAHEAGFSRRDSFLVLCGLHVPTLASTLVLWPRTHFSWSSEEHGSDIAVTQGKDTAQVDDCAENHHLQQDPNLSANEEKVALSSQEMDNVNMDTPSKPSSPEEKGQKGEAEKEGEGGGGGGGVSLRDSVLSLLFLLEMAWLSVLQLRFSFFMNVFNTWLTSLFPSHQDVSNYTNVLMYSMMAGLPICLVAGALFDFFRYLFANSPVPYRRGLFPCVVMLTLTSGLCTALSVSVLFTDRAATFSACVLISLVRSFIYAVDTNIIVQMFPSRHMTAMFSIGDFVGATTSFLQYAFVVWLQTDGFLVVDSVMLGMVLLTFGHPAIQLLRELRTDRKADIKAKHTVCEASVALNGNPPSSALLASDASVL